MARTPSNLHAAPLPRLGLTALLLCASGAGAAGSPAEIALATGERAVVLASGPAPGGSDEREASVHRILPAPRSVYGVPGTHSMRMTYRMNCASRQWSISEVVLYPDRTMSAPPLRRFDLAAQKVSYPPLETDPLASEVFKATCAPPRLALASAPAEVRGLPPSALPAAPAGSPPAPAPEPAVASADAPPPPSPALPPSGAPEPGSPAVTASLPPPSMPGADTASPAQRPYAPAPQDGAPPIALGRPFADASWTLGTLAGLAHHAYTDPHSQAARQQALPVLAALLERQRDSGPAPGAGDVIPLGILNTAIEKAEEEMRRHDADARAKTAFLVANGLVEDVPAGVQALLAQARNTPMLAGLRVEFFRQRDTGEHVIVFRGSAQAEDWLNNLWLGLDLGNIEAPYYQHAEKVLEAFRRERPQARVVVVGHSLGGGLAQHVGNRFGLRVVAFNSSPLPPRYIGFVSDDQQARTRVYTAVYRNPVTGAALADPVSIGVARSAQTGLLAGLGARASQHLVRPTCTLARPDPFSTPEEERAYLTQASLAMGTPSVFSKLGLLNQTAGRMPQAVWVERLSGDPLWAAARERHGLSVQLMGQRLIDAGGRRVFAVQSGLLSAGQIGKQMIDGRVGMLALNLGLKGVMFAARATGVRLLQAHSMERYVRGLQHIGMQGGFAEFNASADADIRSKCDSLQQLF